MHCQSLTLFTVPNLELRIVPFFDTMRRFRRPRRACAAALAIVLGSCATPVTTGQTAAAPFPAEQGRLRIEGRHFYDASQKVWRWRGATQFLLFARFLNGENISPQLDWLLARGFNVLRVFGEVPSGFRADQVGVTNYERPFERADFDARLHAFFALLESRGLRCEYTVLTYWDASDVMRAHVQRVFDVAAAHWNVFVEVANEPENNNIDPVAVMKGIDRRGVLSAYGLDPGRHDAAAWKALPMLDYGTAHDLNRDLEHSPGVTRASLEMQNAFGIPFVNDEPIGAIDPGNPSFKQTGPETWGGANGGGARTVNRDVFISAAAIAYLVSAGYTYHFQAGLEGRVPTPAMTVQDGVALALREVASFIPNDAPRGTFVEPALANGGYGMVIGSEQWVVVPRPPQGWMPMPLPGWHIAAVGPVPYMLRLAK
jgi:hypothetical protein